MLPITVDLARLRVMLIGEGAAVLRRLALLDEAGAGALEIYAERPEPDLAEAAGARLRRRLPCPAEIARAQLVFVAGLPDPAAADIRRVAEAAGVLVNVEDERRCCDFHSASVLRRGDLTVAISTNGKSPGLAAALRRLLEARFGPEWAVRLDEIAALRQGWRSTGAGHAAIGRWTQEWAGRHGWPGVTRSDPSHDAGRPIP